MLRLTDIKLPLDHPDSALADAILARLGISADELTGYTVARRSYDARKRGGIVLIYSLDVETPREGEILQRLQLDAGAEAHGRDAGSGKPALNKPALNKVGPTPDTTYKFVAKAPFDFAPAALRSGRTESGKSQDFVPSALRSEPAPDLIRGRTEVERSPDSAPAVPRSGRTRAGLRPIVIGTGPCGLFAGLLPA